MEPGATEPDLVGLAEQAMRLYRDFATDPAIGDDAHARSMEPVEWLVRQTAFRAAFERTVAACSVPGNELLQRALLSDDNPWYVYTRFMYDHYPAGFGDALVACHRDGKPVDGARIFQRLREAERREESTARPHLADQYQK